MAIVNYTLQRNVTGNGLLVTWASLSTSSNSLDTGQVFPSSLDYAYGGMLFSDKSIQCFRSGTTATVDTQVLIEGSNEMAQVDPTLLTFATLTDPQGNALTFLGATNTFRIEGILENCVYIRPRITTVTTTTWAADVRLLLTSVRGDRTGM